VVGEKEENGLNITFASRAEEEKALPDVQVNEGQGLEVFERESPDCGRNASEGSQRRQQDGVAEVPLFGVPAEGDEPLEAV